MRHNDALFARVDQKLDRYRREARDLLGSLGAALAPLDPRRPSAPASRRCRVPAPYEEHGYLELERRYRGTEEEIRERISVYLPWLETTRRAPVLDLGCGRGEALALLRDQGIAGARRRQQRPHGGALPRAGPRSRGGRPLRGAWPACRRGASARVVSFHVIEHLPAGSLDRLVRLAWRALAARRRADPGDPEPALAGRRGPQLLARPDPRAAGPSREPEADLRARRLRPGRAPRPAPVPRRSERLPEIDLAKLPDEQRQLADRVNRLRDRLDELLFGYQDFGMVGRRSRYPGGSPAAAAAPPAGSALGSVRVRRRLLPGLRRRAPGAVAGLARHVLAFLRDVEGLLLVPGQAGDRRPLRAVLAVGLGAGDEGLLDASGRRSPASRPV